MARKTTLGSVEKTPVDDVDKDAPVKNKKDLEELYL